MLIKSAKQKLIKEVKEVAKKENINAEKLRRAFINGRVVIPKNPIHSPISLGIGENLRIKINANIGTSPDYVNLKEEIEKSKIAIKYGADTIMDLSIGGNIDEIRKKIIKEVKVPIGTVPIYQSGIEFKKKSSIVDMTEDSIFNAIEKHAKDGVDFMTVHCGVNKQSVEKLKRQKRICGVVSRGGSFLTAWIIHNGKENPLYENYDYLLELANKYEFTLSLGDGLRPGCIADATDRVQIQELITIGELVERAREKNVQAIVEGPGHIPLNQISANVKVEKTICKNAPFYVLGPIVSDIFPGYDHIVSAIGGALAGYYGADFLCYVTPAEHLSLPTIEDVKEGVIASKIASHVANLARGIDLDKDLEVAKNRVELDWNGMFRKIIDKEKAEKYRKRRHPKSEEVCSMCGDLCAMKLTKEYLK